MDRQSIHLKLILKKLIESKCKDSHKKYFVKSSNFKTQSLLKVSFPYLSQTLEMVLLVSRKI